MGSYKYRVDMFDYVNGTPIKSMEAYKSEKVADKACERLNTYATEDPYYGKVYYEVVAEW